VTTARRLIGAAALALLLAAGGCRHAPEERRCDAVVLGDRAPAATDLGTVCYRGDNGEDR
jgi:hypothetical protein